MSRAPRGLWMLAAVTGYMALVYLLPPPAGVMAAPIVGGILASRASSSRPIALAYGLLTGIVAYLLLLASVGALSSYPGIAYSAAGVVALVYPLLYHGLATGLVSAAVWGVRGR